MNIRSYIIVAVAGAIIMGGSFSLVSAENEIMANVNMDLRIKKEQPIVVQVNALGSALLRGNIETVSTNSFTIKSWGGSWTVNVSGSTKLAPASDMSQFKTGDLVGVQGIVSQNATWTIDATLVRNWTAKREVQANRQIAKKERHNNEQEIRDVIKNERPKNWQGIVSNINADAKTFTLMVDGTAYTVTLVANARVVNSGFLNISLGNVKEGDTVRVWGPVSETTISAYVLRDISMNR